MSRVIQKSGAVVVRGSGAKKEVLLLYREKQRDWSFPKGHREPGEDAEQAMRRELAEETGLEVSMIKELPPLSYIGPQAKAVEVSMFLVSPSDGREASVEHVGDRLEWIPVPEVGGRLTHENLKEYFSGLKDSI